MESPSKAVTSVTVDFCGIIGCATETNFKTDIAISPSMFTFDYNGESSLDINISSLGFTFDVDPDGSPLKDGLFNTFSYRANYKVDIGLDSEVTYVPGPFVFLEGYANEDADKPVYFAFRLSELLSTNPGKVSIISNVDGDNPSDESTPLPDGTGGNYSYLCREAKGTGVDSGCKSQGDYFGLRTGGSAVITGDTTEVPGPLPILGVFSAFRYSRKLRNSIRSAKETANDI
jgi:hypothetical protein